MFKSTGIASRHHSSAYQKTLGGQAGTRRELRARVCCCALVLAQYCVELCRDGVPQTHVLAKYSPAASCLPPRRRPPPSLPPPLERRTAVAAMYPTIGHFDASVNPLHSAYPTPGGSSSSGAAQTPPAGQHPRPAANGPPAPSPPAFPTLQVTIDPRFQISPPVGAAANLGPTSRSCIAGMK